MKTIRQIADEITVTKQAVHQKIKKEPLSSAVKPFISTVDGTVYISVDGEELIKSAFEKRTVNAVDINKPSTASSVDSPVLQLLQENFRDLQEQLTAKDRQIAEKDKQIADITAALVAAQQTAAAAQALHAGTMKQQLTGSADEQLPADGRDGVPSKRGIFGLFGKKRG